MIAGIILIFILWCALRFSLKATICKFSNTIFEGVAVNLTGFTFVALICYANIALNILSQFNLIESSSLLYGTLIFISILIFYIINTSKKLPNCIRKNLFEYPKVDLDLLLISPLLGYLFFQGLLYAPNNGDSMVYHLPIVEHVLHQKNLSFWPTIYSHQHDTMPGAELVILYINLLTKNDYLSFLPQFLAYITIFSCGKSMLNTLSSFFGNSKLFNVFFVIFLATPMYLVQASTTQNDLVVTAINIWVMDLIVRNGLIEPKREINNINIWTLIIFGCVVGITVKPTGVLAIAVPIVAFLCLSKKEGALYFLPSPKIRWRIFFGALFVLISTLILIGPDLYRKVESHQTYKRSSTSLLYFSEVSAERIFNPLLSLQLHSPTPIQTSIIFNSFIDYLNKKFDEASKNLGPEYNTALTPHEDVAGNPIQVFYVFMIGIPSLLVVFIQAARGRFNRYIFIASIPMLSYLFFGLFIKNQPWLVRLQSPVLATFPLIVASFAYIKPYFLRKIFNLVCIVLLGISLLLAGYHLRMHSLRPFSINRISTFLFDNSSKYKELRIDDYYWHAGKYMRAADDFALKEIINSPCQNITLTTPPFYPIQSRATDQGILFSYYLSELPETKPRCYVRGSLPKGLDPAEYQLIFDAGSQSKVYKYRELGSGYKD